jgi:hypothetical protein
MKRISSNDIQIIDRGKFNAVLIQNVDEWSCTILLFLNPLPLQYIIKILFHVNH